MLWISYVTEGAVLRELLFINNFLFLFELQNVITIIITNFRLNNYLKTMSMNKYLLILLFMTFGSFAFGQDIITSTTQTVTQSGITLGSVIAVVASWDRNKSILWAILHGIFSWFYVIYFALTR